MKKQQQLENSGTIQTQNVGSLNDSDPPSVSLDLSAGDFCNPSITVRSSYIEFAGVLFATEDFSSFRLFFHRDLGSGLVSSRL